MSPLGPIPPSGTRPIRAAPPPHPLNPGELIRTTPRQVVVRSEFRHAVFEPTVGTTIFRALPPHAESAVRSFIYPLKVYDLAPRSAGLIPEVAVPASLVGAPPVEDRVHIFSCFLDQNHPHLTRARTKDNRRPLELWEKDRAAFWAHVVRKPDGGKDDRPVRLAYGSYYAGNAALRPGWLRSLADLCKEVVPMLEGSPQLRYGDVSHPDSGRLVALTINRSALAGSSFGGLAIGDSAAPLANYVRYFAAEPLFPELNVPIEATIRCPTAQELTDLLINYLGHQILSGYVDSSVYELYARCFGEEVPQDRRVSFTHATTSSPAPSAQYVPITAPVLSVAPARRTRIQDDLDERPSPAALSVSSTPELRAASPEPIQEAPVRGTVVEAAPILTAAPRSSETSPSDWSRKSKDELLDVLRLAQKTVNRDRLPVEEICRQLLFRFSAKLAPADFDLIDSVAMVGH